MAFALPDSLRSDLVALQAKAESDPEARDAFERALTAANRAGWTYRQLGEALGVSRSYISARMKEPAEDDSVDFDIPRRSPRAHILAPRQLPPEMLADLQDRLQKAVTARPESTGSELSPAVAEFFQSLHSASKAGWDAAEIALPLSMSPRAVSRFITYHGTEAAAPAPTYPAPPARTTPAAWNARYPAAEPISIPDEEAQRMRELAEQAHVSRPAPSADDDGPLSAAAEYTTMIAKWYLHGASRQELEQATGQGWEAIRKRLSRRGYMSPP